MPCPAVSLQTSIEKYFLHRDVVTAAPNPLLKIFMDPKTLSSSLFTLERMQLLIWVLSKRILVVAECQKTFLL